MSRSISKVLEILESKGIFPEESLQGNSPKKQVPDFPEIGQISENETVYSTTLDDILKDGPEGNVPTIADSPRLQEFRNKIQDIVLTSRQSDRGFRKPDLGKQKPAEPYCAWYCPIHFFGNDWGIYLRDNCVLEVAELIAGFIDWRKVELSIREIEKQLLRSGFYVLFFHEQFHHKVESLGFRLLVTTGEDRYRDYKKKVYQKTHMTSDCLEESLANAECYRRLSEDRYSKRLDPSIRRGLRAFLEISIPLQPPGYAEGAHYFRREDFQEGLHRLQSQILEGTLSPVTPAGMWEIAPDVIRSLFDINEEIYLIVPRGDQPIFDARLVDPGFTTSSKELIRALTVHYGFEVIPNGGKGSHVKLKKDGLKDSLSIPGQRDDVSRGVLKQVLRVFGNLPMSELPNLLNGNLTLSV